MSAPQGALILCSMQIEALNPTLIDVDGRPWWLFEDGTKLPVVRGGDGPNDGGSGGGDGDGSGSGDGSDGGADGGSEDGSGGTDSGDANSGDSKGGENKGDSKSFSQTEVDDLIEKRLAKAKKSWDDEAKTKADRAKLDETERLKAEKADAEKAAQAATTAANAKLVVADAKVEAVKQGVPADRVAAFVKLADLTEVEVDDGGAVDGKALGKAVKKAIDDNPFLKAASNGKGGASGGDGMNGNGGKTGAKTLEDAVAAKYAG